MIKRALAILFVLSVAPRAVFSQEKLPSPYFVSYDHYMEEVDTLDVATNVATAQATGINTFVGGATEFEYGATRWWTPEGYIDWQHTQHEGSLLTGFRFENRFRLFVEERKVNPVLYIEYEHLNGADKALKEIVGFDGKAGLAVPNSESRHVHQREIETRLILSGEIGKTNLTGNFIDEKDVRGGPWEFGYSISLSRPFQKHFAVGIESYGGLGTTRNLTLSGTSHYVAPVLLWRTPGEVVVQFSPGWGLTHESLPTIFRVGVSKDIDDIGHQLRKLFPR